MDTSRSQMDTSRSQMDTSRSQMDTARTTPTVTPRRSRSINHRLQQAGKDSENLHARHRGRRYLEPASELSIAHNTITGRETLASRARSLTPRTEVGQGSETQTPWSQTREISGLSSVDYAVTRGNRGRRHICHGGSFVIAHDHDGQQERIWEPPPPPTDEEQAGGLSSARWAVSNRSMGRGKQTFFGNANTHYHTANSIADPGGPDCSINESGKFTSFLGPAKRHNARIGRHEINYVLEDIGVPEQEFHTKKHYAQEWDVVHADEEYPIGHSKGPDLYTKGFLGKSKHHFEGRLHISKILANQEPKHDPTDLSAYGLGYRGRKKHFKRHNLEGEFIVKSKSMADLSEVKFQNTEFHVKAPFHLQEPSEAESTEEWHGAPPNDGFRRRRKSPNQRSEKDTRMFQILKWNDTRKEEERDEVEGEAEFRSFVGAQKKCFGNAHNASQIMLDYCDPPGHPVEELTPSGLKWGSGHGRKKLEPDDHLKDEDEKSKFEDDAFFVGASIGGVAVGSRASKRRHFQTDKETGQPRVIDPVSGKPVMTPRSLGENPQDGDWRCGIPSGRVLDRGRKYVLQRDTRHTVQPESGMFSYFSDDEQTPRVIRTKSAPTFMMNPAPPSTKRIPIAERGRWKK